MKSFHSSRGSEHGLVHSFIPSDAPILEDSPEVVTRAPTAAAAGDEEREYVISNLVVHDQTGQDTDVERVRAGVPDPIQIQRKQDAATVDADGAALSEKPQAETWDADAKDGRGLLTSQTTVSSEFSRQFTFAAGDDDVQETDGGGEVEMHSVWSLERMKREKTRVDAVLADALCESNVDERLLDDGEEEPDGTQVVDRAAQQLSNYAMRVASRSVVGNELPLTETAIYAGVVVTVNILDRAARDQLRQFPTRQSGTKCGKSEIQWAAIVVGRLLQRAASSSGRVAGAWSGTALRGSVLLVKDVMSMAVTYVNDGPDVELASSAYTWSPSAIRATCRIILDVTDAAVPQQQRHLATDDDDAERDQLALEQESAARMDVVGQQPSSVGLEPSDLIHISSSRNILADETETNDNTNNRASASASAAGRRGSAQSLLRQMFGRRRRDV